MATFGRIDRIVRASLLVVMLAACDTANRLPPSSDVSSTEPATTEAFDLLPTRFDLMPGWATADFEPAAQAFAKQCDWWSSQPSDMSLSHRADYAGTVGDWLPVCEALNSAAHTLDKRSVFEVEFVPFRVDGAESSKLTGYFEPEIEAFRSPTGEFNAPIPGLPDDLVEIDLGQFEPSLAGRKIWAKVESGSVTLYDARADIDPELTNPLGYAHPNDVFFLQIQGSGRLVFDDGTVSRASFAAHNHRPYASLGRYLLQTGAIEPKDATMDGIRRWMDSVPADERNQAMAVNPRYVFFQARPLGDARDGPIGSAGIPLTPLGSLAVDLSHHAHGLPIFVDGLAPHSETGSQAAFQTLMIAQDTGGAITGPVRGDVFFGWGDEAGKRAGSTNSETAFWVLLPRDLANERIEASHAE